MTLSQKQRIFAHNIGKLIVWAYANEFELTFGDAYRDPRLAAMNAAEGKGIVNSLHSRRLAVDFNLWIESTYVPQSEMYRPLGEYWKRLDALNRWGGDWRTLKDGGHFSMTDGGIE